MHDIDYDAIEKRLRAHHNTMEDDLKALRKELASMPAGPARDALKIRQHALAYGVGVSAFKKPT